MSSPVLFHCPCLSPLSVSRPPPSSPPLSTYYHHALSSLLFCEECDAIRCDTCSQQEISCFFCPNCLFEVPSASVRGEKNRCARNCFQCPQCTSTLAVVATDPPNHDALNPCSAAASIGEPPYYLSCNVCRWDSKSVGIEFEKPTGLALQLQKLEESTSTSLTEFDHLKEHFEPYLRRSVPSSSSTTPHPLPARYGTLFSTTRRATTNKGEKDELGKYESVATCGKGRGTDEDSREDLRNLKSWDEVAELGKRWGEGEKGDIMASSLKPLRTPLHTKKSKRCPICKHILIKPEQKSSSTRFKIKLVASNYLPSIELYRRPPTTIGSRLSAIAAGTASGMRRSQRTAVGKSLLDGSGEEEPLRPGRTYTFELSFVNPLYEPIHVRLAVARPATEGSSTTPPYAVNLPSSSFGISAFAEEWEYEDEEREEEEDGRKKGPGVVERKGNRTTVVMEVAVGRDTVGPIRANMLVTYVYQSDDSSTPQSPVKSPTKKSMGVDDVKSFSFWTLFTLGTVMPRAEREGSAVGGRKSMMLSQSQVGQVAAAVA